MGVKSLWKLVGPVGRPVMLETLEGQILAIDSSIWIYQFQATMRDKDGRALSNAHVLGFLRRIAKLLFYGIKPVFVFDGGAPALKRNTLNDRRQKKSGAATSHAKLAEKLLAAQMRREAVNQVQGKQKQGKGNSKVPSGPVVLDENTPRFHDHDPYHLPDVDFEANIANATRATVPDPRLATEDELAGDFDVTSPAFRELPTEVQYEIVGDLRLKSRQTSFARLQNMLQKSQTPLDFSKQQILNLRQRNTLTQQLLTTTDSIGKAHLTIPVRVASERNREYLLIKNEGKDGGWILAVSDVDSDEDMEEVPIPSAGVPDADLQEYQRSMALEAIANRRSSMKKSQSKPSKLPLFDMEETTFDPTPILDDDEDDEQLAFAIQESLDHGKVVPQSGRLVLEDDEQLAFAIQQSLDQAVRPVAPQPRRPTLINAVASSSKSTLDHNTATPRRSSDSSNNVRLSIDEEYVHGNRLATALSIANAGLIRTPVKAAKSSTTRYSELIFGEPILLPSNTTATLPTHSKRTSDSLFGKPILLPPHAPVVQEANVSSEPAPSTIHSPAVLPSYPPRPVEMNDSDEEMEEVSPLYSQPVPSSHPTPSAHVEEEIQPEEPQVSELRQPEPPTSPTRDSTPLPVSPFTSQNDLADANELISDWSRSPSPVVGLEQPAPRSSSPAHENWDAAQEMDPVAEESEFVQFMSQVKGKNLDEVQREIDDEIQVLNAQKRAALRDSEDINQQMVSQIMTLLNLFGIPYITAPMEAEAQCAELLQLGLVNGVITDDSDVFLFGGLRVYKNMFNQSKTVECFLTSDLSREMGLERDALIRLAYLLGSDYVEGLQGVGPVVAMELLAEFPGDDGLHKFKDWWTRVQSGKDSAQDSSSKFRKRFKKNFKSLYLPTDWPNPLVRDAYYHPTVDESEEPFKWGLPDLDALREFLYSELSWGPAKVDELLLPVIQKIRKRSQNGALNKQGNLNGYFDVSGSGTVAPRKRQAYASKRLQQVVSDFRKKRKRGSQSPAVDGDQDEEDNAGLESGGESDDAPAKKPATKRVKGKAAAKAKTDSSASTRGRGVKKAPAARLRAKKRKKGDEDEDDDGSDFEGAVDDAPTVRPPQLRPRPKPKPRFKPAVAPD
ncbi:PIN domain-like protein [Mycena amicta]|nr:PIN domain-like protein [Mycena amicta]